MASRIQIFLAGTDACPTRADSFMPPTGIHALAGLAMASLSTDEYWKWGAVYGSVLPDADLFVSSAVYLFSGHLEAAKKIHRALSHSLVLHGALALFAGVLWAYSFGAWATLLSALAAMMALHTLMDYVYIDYLCEEDVREHTPAGVALWMPWTSQKFALFPKVVSARAYNLWMSTDILADLIFYCPLLLYFSWIWQTDQRFWWPMAIVSGVFFLWIGWFVLWALVSSVSTERYTLLLYYPGILCLLFVMLVPLFFWETVRRFQW